MERGPVAEAAADVQTDLQAQIDELVESSGQLAAQVIERAMH